MSDTKRLTEVTVTVVGGPQDGWTGKIRVPLQDEADGYIRLSSIVYRVRRASGRMYLVHPSAQGLFW